MLGLFSPFRFGLKDCEKYNVIKFRDNIRLLEVIVNRDGEMGGLCPLFFDGAVCQFNELPRPDDERELQKVYNYLDKIRNTNSTSKTFFIFGIREVNKRLHILKIFNKFATLFK